RLRDLVWGVVVSVPLVLLAGADYADRPQEATGNTPIRYVICDQHGRQCFVDGRFRDLDSCQRYKQFSDLVCDWLSTPGKVICTREPPEAMATMGWCFP